MARPKRKCQNCRHVAPIETGGQITGMGCGDPDFVRRRGLRQGAVVPVTAYSMNHTTKCREFWLKAKKDRAPWE